MKIEVPHFKKCCFCLPLRRGVLLWAYLKLIPIVFLIGLDVYGCMYYRFEYTVHWIQHIFEVILTFMCLALTLLLIVAAHRKNRKLLRVSYTSELVAVFLVFLVMVSDIVVEAVNSETFLHFVRGFSMYSLTFILFYIIYIGLQLYIIAMIRSEVFKLDSNHQFRFVNNASEINCKYYENSPSHPPVENTSN